MLTKLNPRRGDHYLLVKDVNLHVIDDKYLLWNKVRGVEGEHVSTRTRTIMADTNVSPTPTIESGFCTTAAEVVKIRNWSSGAGNQEGG